MAVIDSVILSLTERACRRFQRLTGRTNVWLAAQLTNLSIIVYFVWAGLYFWSGGIEVRILLALFCGGLLYVLTQTILKEPIDTHENYAYRRVAKGLRNPRRLRDAGLRISFLSLSIMFFAPIMFIHINFRVPLALAGYALIVLTTVVLYLLACDPLPPCEAKLRSWIRGFARSQPQSVPEAGADAAPVSRAHQRRLAMS
jgi:hypothetical protein